MRLFISAIIAALVTAKMKKEAWVEFTFESVATDMMGDNVARVQKECGIHAEW